MEAGQPVAHRHTATGAMTADGRAAAAAPVPSTWLLVLQPREAAPPLEHTTPWRRPTQVRYPWER